MWEFTSVMTGGLDAALRAALARFAASFFLRATCLTALYRSCASLLRAIVFYSQRLAIIDPVVSTECRSRTPYIAECTSAE